MSPASSSRQDSKSKSRSRAHSTKAPIINDHKSPGNKSLVNRKSF
jgi:hypothetical protein